jgi:hypothetical protein
VERIPPPRSGANSTYDLAVVQQFPESGPAVRTGVLALTANNATSTAGFLRRLLEDTRPLDRVLLITDERVGMPLGDRGQEYLNDLKQGGSQRFRTLELTVLEYMDLSALNAVIDLARANDLEIEPRPGQSVPVTAPEVIDSHHRRGRFLANRLLRELLEGATAPVREPETLTS